MVGRLYVCRVPDRNPLQTQGLPTSRITTLEAPHKQNYDQGSPRHGGRQGRRGCGAPGSRRGGQAAPLDDLIDELRQPKSSSALETREAC